MPDKLKLVVNNTNDNNNVFNTIKNSTDRGVVKKRVSPRQIIEDCINEADTKIANSTKMPKRKEKLLQEAEQLLFKAKSVNGGIDAYKEFIIESLLWQIYFLLDRFDDALKCFDITEKAIQYDEKNSLCRIPLVIEFGMHYSKGLTYYHKGFSNEDIHKTEWEKASVCLNKAISYNLENLNDKGIINDLGFAYQTLGHINLYELGELSSLGERYKKIGFIKTLYEKALSLSPMLVESLVSLSLIEKIIGYPAKGEKYLSEAYALDQDLSAEVESIFTTIVSQLFI